MGVSWIGLNDRAKEGTFVWSDGSSTTFMNFYAGEPNSFQGIDEDCGQFWIENKWNDRGCESLFSYICKI